MVQQRQKAPKETTPSRRTRASKGDESAAIGSLSRGMQVVDVLTSAQGLLTLSEIAALTNLDSSTTLRLLHTLIELGYAVRDDATKRYLAGPRALSPLSLFHPLTVFRREAEQVLISLQQSTRETCALILFLGKERLVVDFVRGRQPLSPYYETWLKSPLHGSASGKLLLAWLSDEERLQLLGPGPYAAHTAHTVTDATVFYERLEEIRDQGYAVARDDAYRNLIAIGVPLIMPGYSQPLGCLVATSTSNLLPEEAEADIVASLKAGAKLLIGSAPSLQNLRHWTPRNMPRKA